MRAIVVYESMYGNTHVVADHIGKGLEDAFDVTVLPVDEADDQTVANAQLLVVGGPTHVHGMSRPSTRKSAVEAAQENDDLSLDADAEGEGLREWFDEMEKRMRGPAAAFDTRIDAAPALTGRASKGIGKRLRRHGFELAVEPESFLVDKDSHLLEGEAERATRWGASVAAAASATAHGLE